MQEITFTKGNEQHLKDCRDALCQSTLGERYFSSPGSAENAILEGIRQENLYVAFIGEECVGFTYIIPKGAFHSFPYLHIIAVKEEYRNKGIGKALLNYSEKIAYEMSDKKNAPLSSRISLVRRKLFMPSSTPRKSTTARMGTLAATCMSTSCQSIGMVSSGAECSP